MKSENTDDAVKYLADLAENFNNRIVRLVGELARLDLSVNGISDESD